MLNQVNNFINMIDNDNFINDLKRLDSNIFKSTRKIADKYNLPEWQINVFLMSAIQIAICENYDSDMGEQFITDNDIFDMTQTFVDYSVRELNRF